MKLFFGNAKTCDFIHKSETFENWCEDFRTKHNLASVIFNNQTHSADGYSITDTNNIQPVFVFKRDGDFLITNQPNIAIGVLTADCLPIIFHDPVSNVIATAHAGWRGTVSQISKQVIQTMKKNYSINVKNLAVWFGASARRCCYEIQPDFLKYLKAFSLEEIIEKRKEKLFFDNTTLNLLQLKNLGISSGQIDMSNNKCTICNYKYHSYRRSQDKPEAKRQATIVWFSD